MKVEAGQPRRRKKATRKVLARTEGGGGGGGLVLEDSSDDEAAAPENWKPAAAMRTIVSPPGPKRPKKDVDGMSIRNSNKIGQDWTQTDAEVEEDISFCCKVCNCSENIKRRFIGDEYIQPSEECLYHRQCCHFGEHGVATLDWLTDLQQAAAQHAEMLMSSTAPEASLGDHQGGHELADASEVYDKYKINKSQEARIYNEDELECKQNTLG